MFKDWRLKLIQCVLLVMFNCNHCPSGKVGRYDPITCDETQSWVKSGKAILMKIAIPLDMN